ncbi:protein NPAT [Leuresthes tenuis]|uniref:protein NPAT n=1 Tax=Leuresthes tenuis TaxID=355514 RepID=UPI003B514B7F
MLLPSDVARLVLGYLQEEGLSATSQAFIHESPNLKEYAEHTTEDGAIPACVFSIFGKGLTTILNEYVATKTKESSHEVPLVMTSLWKKLDFTLNQIKSLQNSPAISASQRTRSRIGMANMARQRVLTMASGGGVVCTTVSETSSIIGPAHTSHSMLSHSTPVSFTGPHTRVAPGSSTSQQIHEGSRLLSTPRDSPVQVIVSEHRLNPGPLSPGRRKWETPRKRSGALSGSSGPGRSAATVSSLDAEPQPEEAVDENFPQLVIQNARDKILGDRALQEKLAENINKILANEPAPQTSKASSSTVEADQSIDEILGLQGEIHMSDDAIHDILEQTESDPAFQALFDLFDYHKNKFTDGETGDGDISNSPEEIDTAGPSSAVRPLQSTDPGATAGDSNASDTTAVVLKMRAGQERKTRKSAAPTLLKKTFLDSSGRASRIENSSARLLVSHGEHRGASAAAEDSNRKEKSSLWNNSAGVTPMDIDEPLNTPPPLLDCLTTQEPAKDDTSTSAALSKSITAPLSKDAAASAVPDETSVSNVGEKQDPKLAQEPIVHPATTLSLAVHDLQVLLSPVEVELNNSSLTTAGLPRASVSSSGGDSLPGSTLPILSVSAGAKLATASPSSASTPAAGSNINASTSAVLTATATSSTSSSSASPSYCAPCTATKSASTSNPTTPSKTGGDSSNIVSLKIIISETQDADSSSNTTLNRAISSISGDKIPTIYLSSPAKSPGCPGTPKANFDEVAQAVSGLQSSEVCDSPLSYKAGAVIASPLTGTSQAQQRYVIQLPMDTTSPGVQGSAASYFLVTPTPDVQARQLLLPAGVSTGQPLPSNPYGVTTTTHSQGYSTGSALILPSPVKPVVLPVSVLGQNTLGKVQMVSNQLVEMPNSMAAQQPKPTTVAVKESAASGTEKNVAGNMVHPENTDQQDAAKGLGHRRILCFDSSASEVQPQTSETTTSMAANASRSQPIQQAERDEIQQVSRTKPNILGGNKPKRRIVTVRCSSDPRAGVGSLKDSVTLQKQPNDPVRKSSRKQEHDIHNRESQSASVGGVIQPDAAKKSESGERKSVDRKHNNDACNEDTKAKDAHSSKSSDSAVKSGSRKDKEENSGKEPPEKTAGKSREGRTEKRTSSQETPNVAANKENEIKGSMQEQQHSTTPSSSSSRDFSPPAVTQLVSNTQPKAAKAPSKTSSLAKQAAEMLQDIQGLKSPSTPVKKAAAGSSDNSLPGTGHTHEAPPDYPRTPSRKKGKDGDGTPKHLLPPNTPDVPTCSPASETGSENSINMAAHTLMILSRAAIARTGTPLKDSLRQEEVGEKSPTSSKNSKNKKRKHSSHTDSPPTKRQSKRSPSKMKEKERKKLVDSFPHDLDVDKFLSSLHYDE